MTQIALPLLIGLVGIALLFDLLNGLHDAANSIATVVSTRVLSPQVAVLWAAFFNFIAFLFFSHSVAYTIGKGTISVDIVDAQVVFGALMVAISWNLITWGLGIPSSSSHALVGGLIGAGTAKGGLSAIVWSGVGKTAAAIFLSPAIGMILALLMVLITSWLFARNTQAASDRVFRRLQLISAAAYSLGHGGNDAQKTMGIIAGALVAGGYLKMVNGSMPIPLWVILAAHAAIALGTLSGGWRIIHTMGSKITKLQPIGGFAAETAGAISLFTATHLGVPVSTTHTITGAIIGVGSIRRLSAVRWGVAGRIVWAWILTIPAAASIAAVVYVIVAATVAP